MGTLITAVLRFLQMRKITDYAKGTVVYAVARAWYDKQPRKVQVGVGLAVLAVVGVVLFA